MAGFFDLTSLQGKITGAYRALVVVLLVLAVVALSDLLFLERQVREGEIVSLLNDAVLEMRREEKNLFLYGDDEAVSRTDDYAAASLNMLRQNRSTLEAIDRQADLMSTIEALVDYRELLARWQAATAGDRPALQDRLRSLGHSVYLSVELLAKRERRMLERTVQESRWFLLLSFLVIGLAIHVLGRRLMRAVVFPISQLESRLMPLAEGRFDHLEPPSGDREFLTFTNAFNRMLKELEVRRKRMLQSDKLASLGILASGVAHELNNPLSNISSSCQLLLEEIREADPAQLEVWLKQIDSETERGRRIVRTLLDFGGQRVFERQSLKLADILADTRTILDKMLRQADVELTLNIPPELRLKVDKQRMQQLFINLIQNALNAAGSGLRLNISAATCQRSASLIPEGAEVAGSLRCIHDHQGRLVEVLVADNGPGIAVENLSRVFDPFFTTNEPGQGVGLGLYIVQEIVREHDGCLAIASQSGNGTRVIMLFPVGDDQGE
jgi:two-component system NtrC family sensor kinase